MAKKIRCPKCDNPIYIDVDRYKDQHALHLKCGECGKSFGVKTTQEANPDETAMREECGSITVLENDNCHKQTLPLYIGKNRIGRRTKGNVIEVAIDSGDDDMARTHCILNISRKGEDIHFILSDFGSRKGTYYRGERLGKYETIKLDNGDSVVIGSTIFVLNFPSDN